MKTPALSPDWPNIGEVLLSEDKVQIVKTFLPNYEAAVYPELMPPVGFSLHGILAYQYHSLPLKEHGDLLHLLEAPMACSHNEACQVIIQMLDDLKEVV